jgi:hypothetical protein
VNNEPFSRKIATFRCLIWYAMRRSLVENDRLPSLRGAPDGWDFARFLERIPHLGRFRFQALRASRPVATNASRWAAKKLAQLRLSNLR